MGALVAGGDTMIGNVASRLLRGPVARIGMPEGGCGLEDGKVTGPKIVQREVPWLDDRTGVQAKKWCVSYMGVDSVTHSWPRQYGYGGLWTENAVQGLCADLLTEGMLDIEDEG